MSIKRRTKIVCTIGPACDSVEMIKELMRAGMNVARLNFSHGSYDAHLRVIDNLKEARRALGQPLAIMLDTKGPEVRIGRVAGDSVTLESGQRWRLVKEEVDGDDQRVSIRPSAVLGDLKVGMKVLFCDGYLISTVVEVGDGEVVVELENGGTISSGKGVNIPNVKVNLPGVTQKDIEDIRFGCQYDIDVIAASFVQAADSIVKIKKLVAREGRSNILVIAKIENAEGVRNFDDIVQVADGIMIARGDLGVEVPLAEVPGLQKQMIRKCYLAGKPSVTATQMLESMISNPRPTRAEASDVANAIYDNTSAVMLSGETAVGKYPLETVRTMETIAIESEKNSDYRSFFQQHSRLDYHDVTSSVTLASVNTAYSSGAKAIFAFTSSGTTARLLSRLRPEMPIVAVTPIRKSYHQLAFNWGVVPIEAETYGNIEDAFSDASDRALEQDIISYGDLVVVTAGAPFGISGTTNMMIVENIGDVLVRGDGGRGERVHGQVTIVLSPEDLPPYRARDQILVVTHCDESYDALLQDALGVVLQTPLEDDGSVEYVLRWAELTGRSAVVNASSAASILKEKQLVTLDPERHVVYKRIAV